MSLYLKNIHINNIRITVHFSSVDNHLEADSDLRTQTRRVQNELPEDLSRTYIWQEAMLTVAAPRFWPVRYCSAIDN